MFLKKYREFPGNRGESMLFGARQLKFGFNKMIFNDYGNISFKPINCKKLAE